MSAGLSLSLILGGLFVVALLWVAVTRRVRVPSVVRSSVVWMRVPDSRDAHAIRRLN